VVIFLGSNDANSKAVFPQYHVPLTEYTSLLGDMVDYITVSKEKHCTWLTHYCLKSRH